MSTTYPDFFVKTCRKFTSVFGWHVLKWKLDFEEMAWPFVFEKGLFVVINVGKYLPFFLKKNLEYFCFIFGSKVKNNRVER